MMAEEQTDREYATSVLEKLVNETKQLREDLKVVKDKVTVLEKNEAVMYERVGTLIKFTDRLATVVYTSAGGLFITIVGSAFLSRGGA